MEALRVGIPDGRLWCRVMNVPLNGVLSVDSTSPDVLLLRLRSTAKQEKVTMGDDCTLSVRKNNWKSV